MEKEGANKCHLVQGHGWRSCDPGWGSGMSQMLPKKRQQSLKLQQTARTHRQWLQPYSDLKVDPSYWRKDFIPIETGSARTARAWDSITALMGNSQSQANASTRISLIWKSERIIFSYLVDPLQEIFISTWEAIRPSP